MLIYLPSFSQRHLDLLESRKTLIRDLSEKHSIPGYDHELSDREMLDFEEKMEEAIVTQQNKLEKIKVGLSPSPSTPHVFEVQRLTIPAPTERSSRR